VWVLAITGALPLPGVAAEQAPSSVSDLRYGVTLYQYFQKDYLAALSELQVADVRGGIEGHGNHPLVLKGAMSLAFGMDRSATDIFEQVLLDSDSDQVRNAAWFYLARMRFRRSDWYGAIASLDRIQGEVEPPLADEVKAMRVNLAIRVGQLPRAELALAGSDSDSDWQPYLYYNLGTAHIRSDQFVPGIDYLDRLAEMKLQSEEHWSIQDKGLIAAGFSFMGQGDYGAAVNRFSQVRLDSPMAEQALLGYGWSAVELGDYSQALGPWQILADQSPRRPAVQEALLAMPYAYEKLGSLGSALREFSRAEAIFNGEIERVEALKSSLQPGELLAAVSLEQDSPLAEKTLDPQLLGLLELLSGDRFSLFRRQIHDLELLQHRLQYWSANLEIYRAMLDQRKVRRGGLLAQIERQDYPLQVQGLREQRDALLEVLSRADTDEGVYAIADSTTVAIWSRLQRAELMWQGLDAAGEDVAEERELLDRYRGLLLWQTSAQALDWHWRATSRLKQLDLALEQTESTMSRLQRVLSEVPDIVPYEQRLAALHDRLQLQHVAVNRSFGHAESALKILVVQELERQQDRLRHYQAQARLARARLLDRAQLESSH
jgi:hypothetical protein